MSSVIVPFVPEGSETCVVLPHERRAFEARFVVRCLPDDIVVVDELVGDLLVVGLKVLDPLVVDDELVAGAFPVAALRQAFRVGVLQLIRSPLDAGSSIRVVVSNPGLVPYSFNAAVLGTEVVG